ncbi:glutamate--cysteine ligase [Lentzea aerocolonigenes]|uniref:glutamate--cysteine ligase n=1 Tax=Lentzea aerocolonigenes TaxID=68170 RepID=UPI0009E08139|nr:glutamate--cysteine ligase [Lentzea aerocolonigenes]MCP2241755.1 carboxylate-amine ligase [Lentzea aerocolonigenes]
MEQTLPTVGVEEEFLLVDPATGVAVNRAAEVVAVAREASGLELEHEITWTQVEINTSVCGGAEQVRRELRGLRRAVAKAAREAGCRAIAVGAPPVGDTEGVISDGVRYRLIADEFGALATRQLICGCHVHVAVPDRETAVQVSNHLRPWLPVLGAVTANSPFSRGADTGFASWRSMVWSQWPVAGPPPVFTSWQHYQAVCDMLLESGTALDPAMVYWDVRPSSRWPTVEVRVADVGAGVDDAVLLAALVRALVANAVMDVERGVPPVPVPVEILRQACWRAARDGLAGSALDVLSGRLVPLRRQLDGLVDRLRPVLRANGDLPLVEHGLRVLDRDGCGADRQRRAFRDGGMEAVLDLLEADAADHPPRRGVVEVKMAADVDLSTSDALERRCAEAVDAGAEEIVLDLSEVVFFGSSGITALARIRALGHDRGVPISVVASSTVARMLHATAMDTLLPLRVPPAA